jgi:hypothetical protein
MISKKAAIISLLIISLIIIISFGVFFFLKKNEVVSPISKSKKTAFPIQQEINVELAKWVDPAEFSMEYPKNLNLNPHKEDNTNYAQIELTSASNAGKLVVWVKDVNTDSLDVWIKENKIQGAIDSTLDGVPAKKVLTETTPKKIITSVINKGYLYQIETVLADEEYWNKVNATIASSFRFANPSGENNSKSAVSNNEGIDNETEEISGEEEVIE